MKNTILIFQKPDLYFFPNYHDIMYAPFSVRERSLSYYLYRFLHICHLPGYRRFWGGWKNQLRNAEKVIIFDFGYQRGMETYIHKINPDCQVFLFLWNKVDRFHRTHELFSDKTHIYSTDRSDCLTYGFRYNHIFYDRPAPVESANISQQSDFSEIAAESQHTASLRPENKTLCVHRLLFVGADKGRSRYILELRNFFIKAGISCDIRIHVKSLKTRRGEHSSIPPAQNQNPDLTSKFFTDQYLPYDTYCSMLEKFDILLDIVQQGQCALTMRVMESLFFSKKLITNNRDILNYDFYRPENIYILPDRPADAFSDSDLTSLREFLNCPFVQYEPAILQHYSIKDWLENFRFPK